MSPVGRGKVNALFILPLLAWVGVIKGQELSADWIPTDLNYAMISRLRKDPLSNLTSQIAGYSTLGVISNQDVANWLSILRQNVNVRDGTVRWQPGVAGKCTSGQKGCTKSIKITVLEFSYVNPNGSDCQANAVLAADAILPPYAVLSDPPPAQPQNFMATGYPITYVVTKAPNATDQNCTYVIQYPAQTQALANTLCFQGNQSCTSSPCVPCNANSTIIQDGPDPENNCTPQNGVSPALVAAIEGAAQCLSLGGMGRFQCQAGYQNNSGCSQMHCFPGDALTLLEDGREMQMQHLRIGDRVQVVRKDGSLGFEDIYFFGHNDAKAVANFIRLTVQARKGEIGMRQHLEISQRHFLHARSQNSAEYKLVRAKDVAFGDLVQIRGLTGLQEGEVVGISEVRKEGLWNPYTTGGSIVVNGVAASVHSEWILDPLLDMLGLTQYLPALYQVLLFPLRLLYSVLGPNLMTRLDSHLNLGKLLTSVPVSNSLSIL